MLLAQAETEECDRATEILTQKKKIDLSGNNIEDVTPLANLQNLKQLGFGGNDLKIRTCPIQPKTVCSF